MNAFEEYEQMVNSFLELNKEYRNTNKKLYLELFKQGYMNQLEYKGKHYYRCVDGQILITNLN